MEKRFKNGLVLGKYMPLTFGHMHLIDTAIEQCETVHVLICSLANEPIPGELRYAWLKEVYENTNGVNIIWCQDENPQIPSECASTDEFYNVYWCPSVYSRIKELDAVFTSEEYGDEFAEYLKVEHVLVDLNRTIFRVSGTKVRTNPFAMWDLIPRCVKNYYVKKVVIMGTESSGKSTLTKKLAQTFNTNYVEEYGRTYCETVKPADEFTVEDFEDIAIIHNENIEKAIKESNQILFVDTEAITTKLFGVLYLPEFKSQFIDEVINKQKFDLYLLLEPDIPWVDDGTRDFPDKRKEHFDMIVAELESRGIEYFRISGEYSKRFDKALAKVFDNIVAPNTYQKMKATN
jgi:HTH-type transcriptional regulator, transcriptional repressor of NAD biosynthesis genes